VKARRVVVVVAVVVAAGLGLAAVAVVVAARLGLVVVAVAVVPAIAVEGWWFLGTGSPKPVTDVAVVTTLRAGGGAWKLTAYVSESDGLCVGLTPEQPGRSGAESCGSGVRGEPNLSRAKAPVRHSVGYAELRSGEDLVFGPAASDVARVGVELAGGRVVETETVEAPPALHTRLRFYAVALPQRTAVSALVARDERGAMLERWRIRR
jgi:hypothetical protein